MQLNILISDLLKFLVLLETKGWYYLYVYTMWFFVIVQKDLKDVSFIFNLKIFPFFFPILNLIKIDPLLDQANQLESFFL